MILNRIKYGSLKSEAFCRRIKKKAAGVASKLPSQEIIVYCSVGGCTSTWWFVLTQSFGHKNVTFYEVIDKLGQALLKCP